MKSSLAILVLLILHSACEQETISSSGMADDHFHLYSDGQYMPVSVRGNLDKDKILVIIHGGPGGSGMVYRDQTMVDLVENECAVVYWDQRFAGNTQGAGGGSSLEDFSKDIFKLLSLIKTKYGEDKEIHLLGHSWGGFLAPWFLKEAKNQNLVTSWIQVGGAHDYRLNDSLTREMLLFYGQQELDAGKNEQDWQEIVDWCLENGFEGADNAGQLNAFAHRAEDLIEDINEGDIESLLPEFRNNRIAPISHLINGLASGIRDIDQPTYTLNSEEMLAEIKVPLFMMWGKYDFICPPALMDHIRQYAGTNEIKEKIFLNSGHSPMMNEANDFWNAVIDWMQK